MRAALIAALLLIAAAAPPPAQAQDKIAYANIEAIISLMPETKSAAQGVDSLGRQLAKELQVKQDYEKQRYEEAQKAAQKGATEAELDKFRSELKLLDDEIRRKSENADSTMARKKVELMQPVLHKLEATIKEIAKAEGYAFVLNSVDGQGNSIVLYGQDDRDITKKILTKLGIPIPKGADGSSAGVGGAPKGGSPKPAETKPDGAKTPAPAPTTPKGDQKK
jgi:outer membrane protein